MPEQKKKKPVGSVCNSRVIFLGIMTVVVHTLLNTTHTVRLRWGASLITGCGYNPG